MEVVQETKDEIQDTEDIKNEFHVEIVKETVNSITLKWNLISKADVYKTEMHHKVKGWQKLVW